MSLTISGSDYRSWEAYGLADYSEFSDKVGEINQRDCGDYTEGRWFYIPDEPHIVEDQDTFRVIYSGTWGNYNSPGASHYTDAELYDTSDEDDMAQFVKDSESYNNAPEWLDDDEYDDEEDMEDEEIEEEEHDLNLGE